jgi:thiol-disulfide isomerase/thioredoxin
MEKKKNNHSEKKEARKKELYQWLGNGAVVAFLYLTGLHTNLIAGLQRAMLLTGFFDANVSKVEPLGESVFVQNDAGFQMLTNEGERMYLTDFEGEVIFINVWASWCPPCIAEMPSIETLYTNLKNHDNIHFVILSLDEDRDSSFRFMNRRDFSMPYHFPESSLPKFMQTGVLPTTYVISKEGEVVYKKEGFADYSSQNFRDWLVELSELNAD